MNSHLSQEQHKPATKGSNRRAAVRYSCPLATSGKVYFPNDFEYQRAWILDISLVGIGMQISRPLDVGTFVIIHLAGKHKPYQLPAHIAHATQRANGEWVVGCELIQVLKDDDLDDLLDV